jgi:hypothetical protein
MDVLLAKQRELMGHIPHGHVIKDNQQGSVVAGFGIIEETLEYLNSIGFKSWRPNPLTRAEQLEEITDILFFYLELMILGEFSWEEIEQEYHRKWNVNMERYRRAKAGDYQWDERGKKEGL